MVAWSYDLLDDDERALLCSTSVFAGGFDLAAITDVLGSDDDVEVLDLLDSLVRKSLVVADNAAGTRATSVFETIRQFAEDELAATGALDATRDRHAAHFAREAAARWEHWNGPEWRDCVDWVEVELANLRAGVPVEPGSRRRRDGDRHRRARRAHGFSVQLFETVGWAEELLDDATPCRRPPPPAPVHRAAWGCFAGRPAEAVVGRADRGAGWRPTRATSRASPGMRGSSRRSARCTAATSTATSSSPSGSPRCPATTAARACRCSSTASSRRAGSTRRSR